MSMNTYPINCPAAFLIDEEVTAYVLLSEDRANNEIPEEIKACFIDGTFAAKAKTDTLPCGYSDVSTAQEVLSKVTCYFSSFMGEIISLFPERSKTPIERSCNSGDDFIAYIPCNKEPNLFKVAYESPDELLNEFKEKLKDRGVELPDDFDWWAHIVSINGTKFC